MRSSTTPSSSPMRARSSSSKTLSFTRYASTTCFRSLAGRTSLIFLTEKVIGLSKMARIVDVFARRLQIQENLTTQIADALMKTLHPTGVAVVIEAKHLCMMMRGVEKQNSVMKTSCLLARIQRRRPYPERVPLFA